jgi:hypothetical protein
MTEDPQVDGVRLVVLPDMRHQRISVVLKASVDDDMRVGARIGAGKAHRNRITGVLGVSDR